MTAFDLGVQCGHSGHDVRERYEGTRTVIVRNVKPALDMWPNSLNFGQYFILGSYNPTKRTYGSGNHP